MTGFGNQRHLQEISKVYQAYKRPGTIGGLPNLNITTILLYKRAGDLNMYVKLDLKKIVKKI